MADGLLWDTRWARLVTSLTVVPAAFGQAQASTLRTIRTIPFD